MKIWTVQNQDVINAALSKDGIYIADFKKSDFLRLKPENTQIYYTILADFNNLNQCYLRGVLFGFMKTDDKGTISEIENFDDFKKFINRSRPAIKSLWNNYTRNPGKYKIYELDFGVPNEVGYEPIFMDINDFQYMMEPLVLIDEHQINRIVKMMATGNPTKSFCPSGCVQALIPYIKKENITNVYNMFQFDVDIQKQKKMNDILF